MGKELTKLQLELKYHLHREYLLWNLIEKQLLPQIKGSREMGEALKLAKNIQ